MAPLSPERPLKSAVLDPTMVECFLRAFTVSKRELARLVGCSPGYVVLFLKERKISAKYAEKFKAALDTIAKTRNVSLLAFFNEPTVLQAPPSPTPLSEISRPPGPEEAVA